LQAKTKELAIRLRRELHRYPELAFQEGQTKQRIIEFIKRHTKLAVVDKGEWFYAVYRAPSAKGNIAFRADMDAVPLPEGIALPYGSAVSGVSHKCGHDGHSAALAALALEIDREGADKDVFFLWQPAEEIGAGALCCLPFLAEHAIEEIYAYHNISGLPKGAVCVKDGTTHFASQGLSIYFEGKPSHASQPELGVNPAYAIANIIRALPALVTGGSYTGEVLFTIVHVEVGTEAFGVSPGSGVLRLTIRAEHEAQMHSLARSITNLAEAEAASAGLKVHFEQQDCFPAVVNHAECAAKVRHAAQDLGLLLVEMDKAIRGSEDFGVFLKHTRGAIFYVGNGEDYPALHTQEYDYPDEMLDTVVAMFKWLAVH